MLAIALARVFRALVFPYGAVGLFLLGTATLLLGVFTASLEVRISHRAVRSEVRWALSLEQWRDELRVRAFAEPVGRPGADAGTPAFRRP